MSQTKVLEPNTYRAPFFGDKLSYITGLDPLGLQNPSVKTYTLLLPGLNNVTGQIRAYSFYCWLLQQYALQINSTDPSEQKKFVRRAEYIIALIAQLASIQGISGMLYAGNQINKTDEFDLQAGTYNSDGSTTKTYWQYPFGVFGQYYVGSLRQLDLIDEPIDDKAQWLGIFRITNKRENLKVCGKDLADSFNNEIKEASKALFLKAINTGYITKLQLNDLISDFNLRKIELNTIEWDLLIKTLLSVDEPILNSETPTTYRKQTIKHALEFVKNNPKRLTDREFTLFAYANQAKLNGKSDDCLMGWYFYQLNEYWQFGCTTMFNGLMKYIEVLTGPKWIKIDQLIYKAVDVIINQIKSDSNIIISDNFKFGEIEINYTESELYELSRNKEYEKRLTYGFILVLKTYLINSPNFISLSDFTKSHQLGSPFYSLSYYQTLNFDTNYNLKNFLANFLLVNIVNRHQQVAYYKMGSGVQSTQKFIIEDGLIRQIGNFDPAFTSPRVGNLITYMIDLKLINKDGIIQSEGEDILKTLLQS